jgi:hypothetical protein
MTADEAARELADIEEAAIRAMEHRDAAIKRAAWIAGRDAAAAVSDRTCAGHLKAGEEQHDEALVNMHATAAMTAGVIDAAIRALEPPEDA